MLRRPTTPPDQKPAGICINCHVVWRARRPRPPAVYCHHQGNVARLRGDRWQVLEAVGDDTLAELREKDLL